MDGSTRQIWVKLRQILHLLSYYFQFNPSAPISADIQGFKKNTSLKDRIHCVCIVIDGSTADILPEKMLEKIKAIQAKMHLRRNGLFLFHISF